MNITDSLIKSSCSQMIYKRGTEYFREGRVHLKKRGENLLSAVVDGRNLYNVSIKTDGDKIADYFCTCAYYETMGCMCKHIVATLMQRQTELEKGSDFSDENDRLARLMCGAYAAQKEEKNYLHLKFIMYIDRVPQKGLTYGMALETPGGSGLLSGIENFLSCYLRRETFSIDKHTVYDPRTTVFSAPAGQLLDVLAENYENRESASSLYVKAAYRTQFGPQTAKRVFSLLGLVDYAVMFDNMRLAGIQISQDNPDILLDVTAADGEITMSLSERGLALTPDGEWFFHEHSIYHTTPEWRSYYMPIYNAMASEERTQISFRGSNTMLFARHILPEIRNRSDVVVQGVDELIVNEEPEFRIYFDSVNGSVTAAVVVYYGSMSLRLPSDSDSGERIVVRNYTLENEILKYFSEFTLANGVYTLDDDERIYDFVSSALPELRESAELLFSDSFSRIRIKNDFDLDIYADHRLNLFEAGFESELTRSQIQEILSAIRLKKRFYRLSDGSFIDLINNVKGNLLSLLDNLDFTEEELLKGSKLIENRYALFLSSVSEIRRSSSFTEYIEQIKSIKPQIPEYLNNVLRGYQHDGVQWMTQLSCMGLGGILADDMGLGKTLQMLAYVHGQKLSSPALVITPSALIYNWLNEINRFIPDASVTIIDGNKETRERLIKSISGVEFVITSYPLLRRDINMYKKLSFSYCFIDEAQYIKNYKTMNAQCVKKIRAEKRFAATGTPVENSLMELWSIFDFIMPGYLGSSGEFREKYAQLSDGGAETELLKSKIHPFILRRMKKDVLAELPEKIENTIPSDLTPDQKKIYTAYLSLAKYRTSRLLSEGGRNRMQILTLIMRLRQICCHPSLFDEAYKKSSGKLELTIELTENAIASGHRVLIFSQFVEMLRIIENILLTKGIRSFYLDGSTPSYERAEQTDRFNGGERDVFLISLKAGGTGLNLTGADMVIHYEPWWNPAVVDQASDRAYRIGQKKAVQIIHLVAKGTIEEKIMQLQERKRSLAEDIISANTNSFKNLTDEEILYLFE